jgi:hypothetical protein
MIFKPAGPGERAEPDWRMDSDMTKRLAALAAFAALATLPASAQPLQVQLSHCLAIPGVLQRLACYDGVARGAGVSTTAPPRTASTAPPLPASAPPIYVPRPVPAPAASFGSERLAQSPATRAASLDRIESVVGFDVNARGKFIVTLANGQVWRQIDGDDAVTRPRKSARSVIIERAVFSSYALTFNDSSQRFKVARVQ